MSTAIAAANGAQPLAAASLESVLLGGDISRLNPQQRVSYMLKVCESLGLNPLTKPFEFLKLSGKEVMYARKDCTEQLRKINKISIKIVARETVEGCYVVTASATDKDGRQDESIGAVPIEALKGEARANAMMKAETKAKRRVTLSISGLGVLDESEIDSIPGARAVEVVGENLEEKLKASVAMAQANKKLSTPAQAEPPQRSEPPSQIAGAAEVLEGEVVQETLEEARHVAERAEQVRMPAKKGTPNFGKYVGDPTIGTGDLKYWQKRLTGSPEPKEQATIAAITAELKKRGA